MKTYAALTVSVLLTAALAWGAPARMEDGDAGSNTDNLVYNGDFETVSSDCQPSGWTMWGAQKYKIAANCARDETVAHGGKASFLILPYIDNSHTAFLITYILLFIAFFFMIKLVGLGLRKVMDVTLTTWFDRTVGGLFGVIKGFFFVGLLFIVIGSFMSGSNNYLKKSISYPLLSYSSDVILAFIQDYDIRS